MLCLFINWFILTSIHDSPITNQWNRYGEKTKIQQSTKNRNKINWQWSVNRNIFWLSFCFSVVLEIYSSLSFHACFCLLDFHNIQIKKLISRSQASFNVHITCITHSYLFKLLHFHNHQNQVTTISWLHTVVQGWNGSNQVKNGPKWSIVLVGWCVDMVVLPWHVGSTVNDDAVQQVQLSQPWPVTEILVDG
jgi:hypothetical protein